jgi:hypothetical protein
MGTRFVVPESETAANTGPETIATRMLIWRDLLACGPRETPSDQSRTRPSAPRDRDPPGRPPTSLARNQEHCRRSLPRHLSTRFEPHQQGAEDADLHRTDDRAVLTRQRSAFCSS